MRARPGTLVAAVVICLIRAGAAAQDQEPPVFRSAVSRVRVDVVVTDEDGEFAGDLTAEDFRVFEDGQPVELLDVQLVDLLAGKVETLSRLGEEAGGEIGDEAREEAFPAGPASDPVADLGGMVYLIDGPSLRPQTKARFADAWEEILERTSSLAVPKAVYFVDNVGRLRELTPMTRDAGRLQAAATEVAEAPLTTSDRRARLIEIAQHLSGGPPGDPGGGGAAFGNPGRRLASQKARIYEAEERARSIATYELLSAVCDALWARAGRTALVWVSSGIKLMQGGPYTALLSGGFSRSNFSPDPRIRDAQEELHRAANSANVSIYAVDPALINETRSLGYDVGVQSAAGARMLQSPAFHASLDALDDALRHAADATGGKAFIHASELGEVLEEIDEHSSRFYLLSYRPLPPGGDGEYHEVRVEVDREDLDVQARRGYVDTPVEERARRTLDAALQLTGTATALPVRASAWISWRDERAAVLVAASVDPAGVGTYAGGDGRPASGGGDSAGLAERMSSLDFHVLVVEGDEIVHEAEQGVRMERPIGMERARSGYRAEEVVHHREFQLEAGADYEIRIAVLDPVSDRVGATRVDVAIPERPDGWHTSDAVLVAVDGTGPDLAIRPVVGGRTRRGQATSAYIEVYSGRQPVLRGQLFAAAATGEEARHAELFAMPLERVGPRAHRGSVPLPTTLPAGRYVVQLQVTDAAAGEQRILRLPFEVLGEERR